MSDSSREFNEKWILELIAENKKLKSALEACLDKIETDSPNDEWWDYCLYRELVE